MPPSQRPGPYHTRSREPFGQPHRGWRDALRFATWAGVMFGFLVADSVISDAVHTAVGPAGQGLVTYVGVTAFFWWTIYFLLAGRVPWRRLVRPAILTALLWIGLELFSAVYFSSSIISDGRLYGTIGVVFSLMIWFIAIGAVVVLGAVAGATWDQHKRPFPRRQDLISQAALAGSAPTRRSRGSGLRSFIPAAWLPG